MGFIESFLSKSAAAHAAGSNTSVKSIIGRAKAHTLQAACFGKTSTQLTQLLNQAQQLGIMVSEREQWRLFPVLRYCVILWGCT